MELKAITKKYQNSLKNKKNAMLGIKVSNSAAVENRLSLFLEAGDGETEASPREVQGVQSDHWPSHSLGPRKAAKANHSRKGPRKLPGLSRRVLAVNNGSKNGMDHPNPRRLT